VKNFLAGLPLFFLAACVAPGYAPIGDLSKPAQNPGPPAGSAVKSATNETFSSTSQTTALPATGEVVVQKGDTLFALAFKHGLDYRDLAFWNNLSSPDNIRVGQTLRLNPPAELLNSSKRVQTLPLKDADEPVSSVIKEAPLLTEPRTQRLPYTEANWAMLSGKAIDATKTQDETRASMGLQQTAAPASSASTFQETVGEWHWPADGELVGKFGEAGGKGINISGSRQSPVYASGAGKVVYSGAGLRGYGKMVIVKHPGEYLTAYAHNHAILVKEGEWVKGGQKIAEMGDTDSDRVKLHFEVRQFGKPVDPMTLLPERR
jgi:lipoprotein NlpD